MSDDLMVDELVPGVWRISAQLRGGFHTVNSYLVKHGGEWSLVDTGPAGIAREHLAVLKKITDSVMPARVFLLDEGANAAVSLLYWRSAGLQSVIVADWRTVLALTEAGVSGPFQSVTTAAEEISMDGTVLFSLHMLVGLAGWLFVQHKPSGLLFSGHFAASFGRNLPLVAETPGRSCHDFARYFAYPVPAVQDLFALYPDIPLLVCPRHGSALRGASIAENRDCMIAGAEDPADGDNALVLSELQKLRADNLELQSAMIFANDSALRDELSGLYDRVYAEEFIKSLLEQHSHFNAAFIAIDRLKEYNREAGVASGDKLIADMASVLEAASAGGFLFRWGGPIFLLISEADRQAAFRQADSLRAAVEQDRRFARPSTVSIALVDSDEVNSDPDTDALGLLQSMARVRLKILERRGGNEVLAESNMEIQESSLVLVLDGDPVGADFLLEFLRRQNLSAVGANRGGQALELIEQYKPELILADAWLPQFDAFQIRERMLSSPDLKNIPFILLVDAKTPNIIARAHARQIYQIFEKPVLLQELLGVIRYMAQWNSDADKL